MNRRNNILFALLAVATGLLFWADLAVGSVAIPLREVWQGLWGSGAEGDAMAMIVRNFRLPKAVMALLAGAALSTVGLQMQTLFRNPLAGPYVLGVSSGASLGVSIMLMGLPLLGIATSNPVVQNVGVAGAAWIGSAAIMLVVMAVTARIKNIMTVLNYTFAQDVNEKMMKKQEDARLKLNTKARTLQNEMADFQRKLENNAFLSRERAEKEQQRLIKKQQELQELEAKLTEEIMAETQKLNAQLADTLNSYIKEFNADGRYHMILTNTAQYNIIIAADQYDVTNQVLEALNNRYKK